MASKSTAPSIVDHDLAVDRGAGRQQLAERPQLREVAQQRPAVPRPEPQLAAGVLEHAAESVPLRLVGPAVTSGSSRTSSASIGGKGTIGSSSAGRSGCAGHGAKLLRSLLHAPRCHHRLRSRDADRARRSVDAGRRRSRGGAASASSRPSTRASYPVADRGRGARASTRRRSMPAEGGAADGPQRPPRRRRRPGGVGRGGRSRSSTRRASGILVGSAIGGIATIAEQQRTLLGAGRRPRLAVLHPLDPRRHGERPDRDPARDHGAELRAGLGLRDRLDRGRRGRRDDRARPGRRRPRGRHGGGDHRAHPRRLLRHARARGGGRRPDPRDAPLRRDAGRLRDGGGGVHPRARGAGGGAGARRDDLRRGARLRRLERRAPPRPARARGDGRGGDDLGGAQRLPASLPSGSATSTRTAPRRRSATSPRRGR